MAFTEFSKICILLVLIVATVESASTRSFIILTEASEGSPRVKRETSETPIIPEIYEMDIKTNVSNRYAKTLITSRVKNAEAEAKEAVFFVVLPEKAFISEFVMEIGEKSYKAYVKEKEEAKNIYDKAVSSGQSAAHVAVSARDSNKFTVSLNIEPESKAVFRLTYEELLQRQRGKYEVVLNIHPGQIVKKLNVEVLINETVPLAFVQTPSLRSGNEIDKNDDKAKSNAEIVKIDEKSSIVKFHPDVEEQQKFAKALDTKESEGLKGQFVVEYDVERTNNGGVVLLNDGYFVHFFAPKELENIPKQVVFVLDISGSMMGRNIEQLIDAMLHILNDLKPEDSFSIVAFESNVRVWSIGSNSFINLGIVHDSDSEKMERYLREKEVPQSVSATPENIEKAKAFVQTMGTRSLTNIIGGLEVGLFIVRNTQENGSKFRQPMIVFLTDGQANVGMSNGDAIVNAVAKLNSKEKQTPIFSLSFGSGADKSFLRKLSSQNLGFSRHIYEGGDASLQLQDFYQLISSPLLKDVTFEYTKNASVATNPHLPIFFGGSEFVIAGRIPSDRKEEYIVQGLGSEGPIQLKPKIIEPTDSLERLWAFLSVRQILDKRDVADKKTELTKKAVDLALKYSFVTPVTSLVVVKPNDTSAVDTENAFSRTVPDSKISYSLSSMPRFGGGGGGGARPFSAPSYTSYNLRTSGSVAGRVGHYPIYTSNSQRVFGGDIADPALSITNYIFSATTTTHAPATSIAPRVLPIPLPELQNQEWFKLIMNDMFSIKIVKDYKLATNRTTVPKQPCSKTILNKSGNCTLLHECPKAMSFLTDLSTFIKFFCPLEGYAGICCDT